MSQSVNLPALGESVTEGTVTRWLKSVGDRVEVDEPLLEVSTDKVDTEVPSPVSGVLEEILVNEDETVDVGSVLARVGDGAGSSTGGDETAPEAPQEQEQEQEQPSEPVQQEAAEPQQEQPEPAPEPEESTEPEPAPQPAQDESAQAEPEPAQDEPAQAPAAAEPKDNHSASTGRASGSHAGGGYITPIVRKLANEQGVDLATVTGSGVGGRIRKEDVLDAATAEQAGPAAGAVESAAAAPEVSALRGTSQPMTRLRKVVAERAVASIQNSAQLTTVVEADVTALVDFRDAVADRFQAKTGVELGYLPFFMLAAAEALKAHPVVNATIDGDTIVYPDHEHICMAVDTERGLLTPVIRDASEATLATLAAQIADLTARTGANSLKPEELSGGTFTVTDTGSRGALFDTPVVFLPQVAVLGTGAVTKRPAIVTVDGADAIAIRSTVYLSLSYDQRIVDGAEAARFLSTVSARLTEAAFEAALGIE